MDRTLYTCGQVVRFRLTVPGLLRRGTVVDADGRLAVEMDGSGRRFPLASLASIQVDDADALISHAERQPLTEAACA